jgi:hypothetical protein
MQLGDLSHPGFCQSVADKELGSGALHEGSILVVNFLDIFKNLSGGARYVPGTLKKEEKNPA